MILRELYPLIKNNEYISVVYEDNRPVLGYYKKIETEEDLKSIENLVVKEITGQGQFDLLVVVEN